MSHFSRFEVYRVNLDPVIGSEVAKSRPCVVLSPDEMNVHLHTLIVAPMTSTLKHWPSRVLVEFAGQQGEIALDQMRAVDKQRCGKRLGALQAPEQSEVLATLARLFAR
jgi:mRNA interferase MazF